MGIKVEDTEVLRRARRWHRALQEQIAAAWAAQEDDETVLTSAGFVVGIESFAIATMFAGVAICTLDNEVLKSLLGAPYTTHRDTDSYGEVVGGFRAVRNADVHVTTMIDPDVDRIISLPLADGRDVFRTHPRWKTVGDLASVFGQLKPHNQPSIDAYERCMAGRLVTDTLLDALRFFVELDPDLATREQDGELRHFPLPLRDPHGYERCHPNWPTPEEAHAQLRAEVASRPPAGVERHVEHRLVQNGETVALVGMTKIDESSKHMFTETVSQVVADIEAGFPYLWNDNVVKVANGRLSIDPEEVPEPVDDERWSTWFALTSSDAHLYQRQRNGM